MRTVSTAPVAPEQEGVEELSERVREALGELAGAAKEGLLALSVGVGLGVLHELMEAEVDEVVGPKGRHDWFASDSMRQIRVLIRPHLAGAGALRGGGFRDDRARTCSE
jgi:hypothetical protein